MTEVTIPTEIARQIAAILRGEAGVLQGQTTLSAEWSEWRRLADFLEPLKPQTLADDVAQIITHALASGIDPDEFASDVVSFIWNQIEKTYGQHPNDDARTLRNHLAQLFHKGHNSDWIDE